MSDNIKAGDRVRLTFTHCGAEHVVTGVAEAVPCELRVGNWSIDWAVEVVGGTVELLAPAWHDTLVVQAGGKTFANDGNFDWYLIGAPGGLYTTDEVAALGPVRVIVDADGQVVTE